MYSQIAASKQAQIDEVVAEAVKELGPMVVRVRHNVGEDWTGDPAIFFRVVLPDRECRGKRLNKATTRIRELLRDKFDSLELGRFAYFSFRSETEALEMPEEEWD
jgi:hypothetical protein